MTSYGFRVASWMWRLAKLVSSQHRRGGSHSSTASILLPDAVSKLEQGAEAGVGRCSFQSGSADIGYGAGQSRGLPSERRRNRCRQEGTRERKNPELPGEAERSGV